MLTLNLRDNCKVKIHYSTYWYQNGKIHRDNGPAAEDADGTKHWFLNGNCHRLDGPAVEYADGRKAWYQNGKYIR